MGRLLHELGETSDKELNNFQRQSEKIGKSSFAFAWTFDAMDEERERFVPLSSFPVSKRTSLTLCHSTVVSLSTSPSIPSLPLIAASLSSTRPVTATSSPT
jgi:translation elongation factor EF-1alpha